MSEPYALLIVGGGPAGLAAARAFRGASGVGKVAIVADEHRIRVRAPTADQGPAPRRTASEEALPIEPEPWLTHQRVDLVAGRVVALDPGRRVASLSGGRELPTRRACSRRAPSRRVLRSPAPIIRGCW